MTRIAVVSDSHNMTKSAIAQAAACIARSNVDLLIHLGDGAADARALAAQLGVPLSLVCGNCDRDYTLATEEVHRIEGTKLLICHGHTLAVKLSLLRLSMRAEEVGAAVALYGHTHVQRADEGSCLLLNPGALRSGHYALLTMSGGAATYDLCHVDR